MTSPDFYEGREQTLVKHLFLARYLERLAFHILPRWKSLVYVDGFSGPWRSQDQEYSDTSFSIAVQTLRRVRGHVKERHGNEPEVLCAFVEKDPEAFTALQRFVATISDMTVKPIPGEFEAAIPELLKFVGDRFSFVFIDPTGWTGFGMQKIEPLLKLRGEVLINFMFLELNRFLESPDGTKAASFNSLFGDANWYAEFQALVREGQSKEDAVLETYRRRLKKFGNFKYVTSTRVKSPQQDRTYFHLVYATKSPKGIIVFRAMERKAAPEQELIDAKAKERVKAKDTRQTGLFGELAVQPGPRRFEDEQRFRLNEGRNRLMEILRARRKIKYPDLCGEVQQVPLVWEPFVKDCLEELHKSGQIRIEGLRTRSTRANSDCVIHWLKD